MQVLLRHFSEKPQEADLSKCVPFSIIGSGIAQDLPHSNFYEINAHHSLHSSPGAERCPMDHMCFHYTCNRQCRQQGRKQTQPPNGFIPVFLWALVKTESTLQHSRCGSLQCTNYGSSYLLSRQGLIPKRTRALHSWGQVGLLLQSSAGLSHLCVLPLHLLPPSTVLCPPGAASNPQAPSRQEWGSQLS